MALAWVVNGTVQDVAPGDPHALYAPEVATLYTTTVPAGTVNGATKVDGKWTNPAPGVPTAPTLDMLKARLHADVVSQWEKQVARGVAYTFPDGLADVIQTRDTQDTLNVNGMVTAALILQSQGVADPVLAFRGESNITHPLTPAQMIQMGMAVQGATLATYGAKWTHDAAIDALTTIEQAQAYDVTAGWPA